MKKVEISGIIKFHYDLWDKIKLVQPDGYEIDLVHKFKEIKENYEGCGIQVNYWISNKPCTKDKMLEKWLMKVFGDIEADYEENEYYYSSWTWGTDYDTVLKIGGHDLYNEISGKEGKYIIFEINISKPA